MSAHPNAGLPNAFGEYDETPAKWPRWSGSSPPAVSSTSSAAAAARRHIERLQRRWPVPAARDSGHSQGLPPVGLGPFTIDRSSLFVNVGERTITSSAKFARLIREENYTEALEVALQRVEAGAR